MTTTAWAHLPNAGHIDRVLASLETNPEKWTAAQTGEHYAANIEAWYEAWETARDAAWDSAWYEAWDAAVRSAARDRAWEKANGIAWPAALASARDRAWEKAVDKATGAILALIAWDDCAIMLDLSEDALKLLRAVGDEQALLLSVAAKVLKETS